MFVWGGRSCGALGSDSWRILCKGKMEECFLVRNICGAVNLTVLTRKSIQKAPAPSLEKEITKLDHPNSVFNHNLWPIPKVYSQNSKNKINEHKMILLNEEQKQNLWFSFTFYLPDYQIYVLFFFFVFKIHQRGN